jgi:hypothetical protein
MAGAYGGRFRVRSPWMKTREGVDRADGVTIEPSVQDFGTGTRLCYAIIADQEGVDHGT